MTSNRPRGAPSARALLFTILAEYLRDTGTTLWTNTLVEALGTFDIAEPAARRAIARVADSGWIVSERAGRRVQWSATPHAIQLFSEARHEAYVRRRGEEEWDGRYLLLLTTVSETQRHLRHLLRTQLTWLGFGAAGRGIWISPRPDVAPKARDVLTELGIDHTALSFLGTPGPIGSEFQIVREAWDLTGLARDYEEFSAQLEAVTPPDTKAEAFATVTRLVHRWRGFILDDPWLPRELLPGNWPGHHARELFHEIHDKHHHAAVRWLDQTNELFTANGRAGA